MKWTLSLLVLLAAATLASAAAPAQPPPAPPDAAAVEAARKRVWDRFKDDFKKTTADDRRALAEKLLQLSQKDTASVFEPLPNPAEQFALLLESRDLAIAARDVPLAVNAIQAAERSFTVPIDQRLQWLTTVADVPEASEDRTAARLIARRWLVLCDDAAAAGDTATAATAATRAAAAADNARETMLAAKAADRSDRLMNLIELSRRARAAEKTLAEKPDDPAANLQLGKYHLAVKGDWDKGLAALAEGSDADLKSLAGKDRAGAATPEEWINLGDAWLSAAAKQGREAAVREAFRLRARRCFEAALPLVAAEDQPAVRKRLRGLPGAAPAPGAAGVDYKALAEAAQKTKKSPAAGGEGGGPFEDVPGGNDGPALLVGVRYTTTNWSGHKIISSIRPIFLGAAGKKVGEPRGVKRGHEQTLEAKDGYAVGAVIAKGGLRPDGFKLVFMRVRGAELDPDDAYESEWVGGKGGGGEVQLGGDGRAVVGIHGRVGGELDAFGIVQVE